MTTNHIDQLTEWWENAEKGAPSKGDAIIRRTERLLSNGYAYEVGTEDYTDARHLDNVRILARAPKPKPAWHDAPAVIATFRDENGVVTGVWVPEGMANYWEGPEGDVVAASALENVTPLIKAKVTDEMVLRALNASTGLDRPRLTSFTWDEVEDVRFALHAALGLDPDTGGIA